MAAMAAEPPPLAPGVTIARGAAAAGLGPLERGVTVAYTDDPKRAAAADTAFVDDDADNESLLEEDDRGWVTWLCGAGSSLWPLLRTELLLLITALLVVLVAAVLAIPGACPPARCTWLHESVSRWLWYLATVMVVAVPGRLFDRAFFAAASAVGQAITLSVLLPVFFFVSALEGAISRLWVLSMAWALSDAVLTLSADDMAVFDKLMSSLLVFQLLSIGRQLALRVLMRTVLIESFEGRIQDALFANLVLLTLGQRHAVDPTTGRLAPARRDVPLRELARMFTTPDIRRKLDFVSKARFRLYAKGGDEVVPISRAPAVAGFAKSTFKKLAFLPPSVLVDVERKDREQITSSAAAVGAAAAAGGGASRPARGGDGTPWGTDGGGATPGWLAPTPVAAAAAGTAATMGGGSGLARSPRLGPANGTGGGSGGGGGGGGRERAGTTFGDILAHARGAVTTAVETATGMLRREPSFRLAGGHGGGAAASSGELPLTATHGQQHQPAFSGAPAHHQPPAPWSAPAAASEGAAAVPPPPQASSAGAAGASSGASRRALSAATFAPPSPPPGSDSDPAAAAAASSSISSESQRATDPWSQRGTVQRPEAERVAAAQPVSAAGGGTPQLPPRPAQQPASTAAGSGGAGYAVALPRPFNVNHEVSSEPSSGTGAGHGDGSGATPRASAASVFGHHGQSSQPHTPRTGPAPPTAGGEHSRDVIASLNRMLGAGGSGVGDLASTRQPHMSSIGATMGRLLRDQLRGVIQAYVPQEELEELDAATSAGRTAGGGGSGAGAPAAADGSRRGSIHGAGGGGAAGGLGRQGTLPGSTSAPALASAAAAAATTGAPHHPHLLLRPAGAGARGAVPSHHAAAGGSEPGAAQPAPAPPPPPKVYPKLRLAHFAAVLPPESGLDAEKALALFDTNADGLVELPEFIAACEDVYAELRALKASLSGHQSVSTAMQSLLDVVFWLVLTFLALLIWQVSVVDVYVPLGTVLVSASFAIGASLSQIVSSLIFVLVTRPYNVGDRVTASGVFNGEETLIVKKVDVLTTTFWRLTNKQLVVPNWTLCTMAIENFRRSPPAVMKIDLSVAATTTAVQLETLRRRVDAYLLSAPLAWKPGCLVRCGGLRDQALLLSVWASSHYAWQDAPRLFRAAFLLHLSLAESLRECGIAFRMADQSLRVEGTLDTRVIDATTGRRGGGAAPAAGDDDGGEDDDDDDYTGARSRTHGRGGGSGSDGLRFRLRPAPDGGGQDAASRSTAAVAPSPEGFGAVSSAVLTGAPPAVVHHAPLPPAAPGSPATVAPLTPAAFQAAVAAYAAQLAATMQQHHHQQPGAAAGSSALERGPTPPAPQYST